MWRPEKRRSPGPRLPRRPMVIRPISPGKNLQSLHALGIEQATGNDVSHRPGPILRAEQVSGGRNEALRIVAIGFRGRKRFPQIKGVFRVPWAASALSTSCKASRWLATGQTVIGS